MYRNLHKVIGLYLIIIFIISCAENPPTENLSLKIEGRILSKGGSVPNAIVKLSSDSRTYSQNTNEFGEFMFKDIESNTYDLSATMIVENQQYTQVLETNITNSINLGDLTFEMLSFIVGNVDLLESEDDRLAEVFLLGTGINALTDSRGDYKLLFIPPGIYDILVRKEGYLSKDSIAIEVGINEVDTINFELTPIISEAVTIDKIINMDRNVIGICAVALEDVILGVDHNNVFTIDTINGTTQIVSTFYYPPFNPTVSDLIYYPDYQLVFCKTADFSTYSYYIDAFSYNIIDSVNFVSADLQGAFYSEGYLYATYYDADEIRNRVFKSDAFNPYQASYLTTVDSLEAVYDMLIWDENIIIATGKHKGKNMFALIDRNTFSVLSRYYIPENRTIYRIEKINNALWGTNWTDKLIKFNFKIL
jgi:hypothetical protein